MKNSSKFKLVAIIGAGLGLASTLLGNWAASREMEETVKEEVNKALAEQNSDES